MVCNLYYTVLETHCFCCFHLGYIGYLQQVTEIQQSKRSSNFCYDIVLQTAEDDTKVIRLMQQEEMVAKGKFLSIK